MSKIINSSDNINEKLLPIKCEEKSLIVVKPKVNSIMIIGDNSELIVCIAKKLSIALIGTISIAYIVILTLIATSVFYVSNLKNGLIQKRSFYQWNECFSIIERGSYKCIELRIK